MTGGAAIIACSRDAGAAVRGLSGVPPPQISRLGASRISAGVQCSVGSIYLITQRRVDVFGDAAGSRTIGIDACLHVSCITTLLGDP